MANLGRFVCVLVPFALTLASLIAMLVAGLAGIGPDKSLYMFQVNVTDLSISTVDLADLFTKRSLVTTRSPVDTSKFHNLALLTSKDTTTTTTTTDTQTTNLTASELGLANIYQIGLWGYCSTAENGTRSCSKAEFNWASKTLNTSNASIEAIADASGTSTSLPTSVSDAIKDLANAGEITLPSDIVDALKLFSTLVKWTEVVFIIAWVALAVELFFGIFANCSRAFSCITFLVAAVATVAVVAAAAMATATSVVVVGSLEGTAKWYGVTADFSTKYLAAVWIGAAFAIAAGFFWMFTVCCCAPDHNSRRSGGRGYGRKRHLDDEGEKLMPVGGTGYQPLHEPNAGFYSNQQAAQYGAPRYPAAAGRSDLAYEPYAHARV